MSEENQKQIQQLEAEIKEKQEQLNKLKTQVPTLTDKDLDDVVNNF